MENGLNITIPGAELKATLGNSDGIKGSLSGGASLSGQFGGGKIVMNDYRLTVEEIENGGRFTVKRGAELQTLEVYNGVDGRTPEKYVDYFTAADKSEFTSEVLETLKNSGFQSFPKAATGTLIENLRNAVFISDQTQNIVMLQKQLEDSAPDVEEPTVQQIGNILKIFAGVSATQNGSALALA